MIFTWYLEIFSQKKNIYIYIFRNTKISSTPQDKIHTSTRHANKQEHRIYHEKNQLIKANIYVMINKQGH